MDRSDEDVPLLRDSSRSASYAESSSGVQGNEESVDSRNKNVVGGASVTCRVCDAQIALEGRNTQHVVKCSECHEATPIRPAPTGKKYVRCPCNCLLICKAASTRIACPRANCRRVITLISGNREPQGSAVRAPTGSCRVSCVHCREVFLFNTLNNSLAKCPHCKKNSTIGGFARRRALLFLLAAVTMLILSVLVTVFGKKVAGFWVYVAGLIFYSLTLYMCVQFIKYWLVKMSTIIGPI
ncbi:unnamed protein product [Auanema sp. JU1783]|nr:unnamed protein product [Auanema sp. JU1783]